jgi:DNA-binding transcriptional LysR family regulator
LQIANIEETFGVILFHRRPRPELTTIGREICNRARIILGRVAELETSLDQLKLLERGQLAIGISAPRLGLSLLAEFMRAFPAVAVRTVSGNSDDLLEQLEQNRIDAAVVALLDPIEHSGCKLVEHIHLCAWLPVDHPLVGRQSLSLAEVGKLPLVMRESGSVTRRLFERACAREGVTPQVRLQVHSRESVREAVAAGIAAGVVFNSEADADSRVTSVPIHPQINAGTYIVYLKEMTDLPTVKGLLNIVAAQLAVAAETG